MISGIIAALISLLGAAQERTEDVWVFCGPNMADPVIAQRTMESYASHGVDVTMGPCNAPDWSTYSPAFPGQRYSAPEVYMELVKLARPLGMRVAVYDERVWSEDPAVRREAARYWLPVAPWIAAWDLGDEFPEEQWPILVERWHRTDVLGIRPYANHLRWMVDAALRDLDPTRTSFDVYDGDKGASIAAAHSNVELMCAVNGYDHGPFVPTVAADRALLAAAGCDRTLIFGGPPLSGVADFEEPSLVDALGYPTERLKEVNT